MSTAFSVLLLLSCCAIAQTAPPQTKAQLYMPKQSAGVSQSCLPEEIKLDDVVTGGNKKTAVTVTQKLKQLGASCKSKNKLVAKNGKPIYFYKLTGCWGMAPQNYEEILAEQARKIGELEKKYEVIQMTCNPTGADIQ
jgi:hypothetical protein